ncbi:ABC transporter permease [Pseudonocardia sp.]
MALRSLLRDWVTLLAGIYIVVLLVSVAFPAFVSPYSAQEQNLRQALLPPLSPGDGGPPHILGTDAVGRDVLSLLIEGGRISITVAVISVLLSGLVGVVLGLVAGYRRGWVDDLVMRVSDLQLGFPTLLIALFVLFTIGPGFANMLLVMAILRWPVYARLTRGLVLSLREREFVEGAVALGAGPMRIIFRHILPNLVSPLVVLATLELARMILLEATLSYLGLGIQAPLTSWGLQIEVGNEKIRTAWWLVTMPGTAMFLTALSVTLFATWLRGITDPTDRWRWLLRGSSTHKTRGSRRRRKDESR